MSLYGLGLGAIHLLYLARDVALNLNCLLSYTLYWALTLWGKKVHVCMSMRGRQRLMSASSLLHSALFF